MSHRETVSHSENFAVPAASVWNLLIDWGSIIDWMPPGNIRHLRLEGEGIGAVRHIVTEQAVAIAERLDDLDESRGQLRLSIIEPMPWGMLSYSAITNLEDAGPDQCRLDWSGTFELAEGGDAANELAAFLKKAYASMFAGIRKQLMDGNINE